MTVIVSVGNYPGRVHLTASFLQFPSPMHIAQLAEGLQQQAGVNWLLLKQFIACSCLHPLALLIHCKLRSIGKIFFKDVSFSTKLYFICVVSFSSPKISNDEKDKVIFTDSLFLKVKVLHSLAH